MTTVTIVNAIIYVGQLIAAASAGGGSPGGDAFKKSLDELKKLLFPDEERKLEEKAEKFKRIMEAELERGPFKVAVMDDGTKKKGGVRLRRR